MNIQKLRECTSIAEADSILSSVRAGPAIRKLVETGVMLKNHPDAQQRQYGQGFINSAIQELDADEEPTPAESPGLKTKGDKFVKEELLAGGDKDGTDGSEQSTDNTEPYPQVAKDSDNGEKDMEKMSGTEDQMKEGFPGQMPGGPQGGMPGGMPGMMPGLEPSVANEMGAGMPQLPPMSTPQMMKQMQYTLEKYHRNIVAPLRKTIAQQKEAIHVLSKQIRESEAKTGSMKLDIDSVKRNAMATPHSIKETAPSLTGPTIVGNGNPNRATLEQARSDIANMDKTLRGQSTPYQ